MPSKTIIVVGSPRGGTSMTTGIIERLGIDMGHSKKQDNLNPTGYYEDKEIQYFAHHLAIPYRAAIDKYDKDLNQKLRKHALSKMDDIKDILNTKMENTSSDIWGWKVLDTCYMLDAFTTVVPNPHLIFVTRNILDVGKSLERYRREKKGYTPISVIDGMAIGLAYYQTIIDFIDNNKVPALQISYEDIIYNDYINEIDKICNFIDIDKPKDYRIFKDFIRR